MALNWQFNPKTFDKIKDETHLNETIVMATIFIGFPRITESNWEEFYKRLHLVEKLNGTFNFVASEPYFITPEDIKRRIGLTTNASSFSRTEFTRRQMNQWYAEGNWK